MIARVGLCMMVKDEADVIARSLESTLPYVDSWSIVDTGSTDGTQQIIRDLVGDLPGELHERPWKDFGHNRSEALELARPFADYSLFVDADEILDVPEGFHWPELTADAYGLQLINGSTRYWLDRLTATRLPWRYEGVTHEYLHVDEPNDRHRLQWPRILYLHDGARARDLGTQKYVRDAEMLERGLREDPNNPRYRYYLARSYYHSGELVKALGSFQVRVAMGGFEEEVFDSLLSIATIRERMGAPSDEVVAAYLAAYERRPSRAEPLCELARHYRQHERYHLARLYASYAVTLPMPEESLWVDQSAYTFRARDELAVNSTWTGHYAEAAALFRGLLADENLPDSERDRIQGNLELAESHLVDDA